ncbi:MAG: hypothetical protein ACREXW_01050 [Gammaproteobacteria bacterium]
MAGRQAPDWTLIEREYRGGQLSVSEIARQGGVSRGAVQKRAKKDGWARDLLPEVEAKVRQELVRDAAPDGALEAEAVEAAAARSVEVVRQHRVMLGRLNRIATRLVQELELHLSGALPAPKWMRPTDTVAGIVLRVAQALGKAVPLERQAFAIGADEGRERSYEELLRGLCEE